ncbi:hypothetical protein PG994_008455 [Apiospora phragmitis]|uniref:Uncharacterized protein n=1 Tax=Apiospora phragmitis TaxID=2905665 RepID=A0ABR1UGG2_9PEZI
MPSLLCFATQIPPSHLRSDPLPRLLPHQPPQPPHLLPPPPPPAPASAPPRAPAFHPRHHHQSPRTAASPRPRTDSAPTCPGASAAPASGRGTGPGPRRRTCVDVAHELPEGFLLEAVGGAVRAQPEGHVRDEALLEEVQGQRPQGRGVKVDVHVVPQVVDADVELGPPWWFVVVIVVIIIVVVVIYIGHDVAVLVDAAVLLLLLRQRVVVLAHQSLGRVHVLRQGGVVVMAERAEAYGGRVALAGGLELDQMGRPVTVAMTADPD